MPEEAVTGPVVTVQREAAARVSSVVAAAPILFPRDRAADATLGWPSYGIPEGRGCELGRFGRSIQMDGDCKDQR